MNERCKYSGFCGWSCYGAYCKIKPEDYPRCDLYQKYEARETKETISPILQEIGRKFREGLENRQ